MDREQLIEDLKRDEGWEPSAYQDTLGYWTIGYGFLIDERKGGKIPESIGEMWLTHNVETLIRSVRAVLPWFDDQPEPVKLALCNMAYQLGVSGLKGFTKTLDLIRQGRYREAGDEALNSNWAEQTPDRAQRMARLIRSGAIYG
jgi:lysozyme